MIITLTLDLHEVNTKGGMFQKLAELADTCENIDVEIVDFTEQKVGEPVAPKVRKARGPNKAKLAAMEQRENEIPHPDQPSDSIPGFLKRT